MSNNLIIPVGPQAATRREEFRLPEIEIPKPLQEDFAANPHLEPVFYQTVAKALNISLNSDETRLRTVTAEALKERIEICYRTVVTLRYDLKYSLRKCLDLLPQMLVESLIRGERTEDTFERKTGIDKAWATDKPAEQVAISREDADHAAEVSEADEENAVTAGAAGAGADAGHEE